MPSYATVRRWRSRSAWPALLGTVYAALYLSYVVFEFSLRGESALAYFLGPRHEFLAQPFGWLFVLSAPFAVVWLGLTAYSIARGF